MIHNWTAIYSQILIKRTSHAVATMVRAVLLYSRLQGIEREEMNRLMQCECSNLKLSNRAGYLNIRVQPCLEFNVRPPIIIRRSTLERQRSSPSNHGLVEIPLLVSELAITRLTFTSSPSGKRTRHHWIDLCEFPFRVGNSPLLNGRSFSGRGILNVRSPFCLEVMKQI